MPGIFEPQNFGCNALKGILLLDGKAMRCLGFGAWGCQGGYGFDCT